MATALYKDWNDEVNGIGNMKLLVFLDYMSLPQSSAGATFLGRQQFGLGLGGVNVLYAHSKTLTLLCTESHLNHVDGPDARTAYNKSGWPVFEREVTALGTPPMWTFDLPTCVKWIDEKFVGETGNKSNQSLFWLREAHNDAQTLPCNKEEFSRVVKDLNFMNGSDRGFVDKKFAETSEQILGAATELVRENVTRATAEEWSVLLTATMPKYMNRLVTVQLRFNPLIQGVLSLIHI